MPSNLSGPLPRAWEKEEVFASSDEFFAGLMAEIKRAKQSIYFEVYLFELDPFGKKILKALEEVAERGVQVKLMVDGVGSPAWNLPLLKELEQVKVNARIYKPYPWVRLGFRFFPKLFNVWKMGRWFRKLNRRNHRKVCVIDNKLAWLGSMNVCENLLRFYAGERAWRDTGVRVEGESVQALIFAFERAWIRAWGGKMRSFRLQESNLSPTFRQIRYFWKINPLVRLNLSFYLRNFYYQDLLNRLHSATQRIWITSAYFIPSGAILRALRAAAWAGVDVRILVSRKMDVRMVRWLTSILLYELLRAGVKVFEYEPRVLHAKTILIDYWATIGSSNLNHRSLIHDLEVDVVVQKPASLADLEKYFLRDEANAEEMNSKGWKQRFWLQRILGRIFFFFRYWL